LIWALLLAGIAAPGEQVVPVVPFRNVWEDTYTYDGKRIRVTGWLGTCNRSECWLYPSADREPSGIMISIGKSAGFDRSAARLRDRWVTVEGTIRARCFSDGFVVDTPDHGTLLLLHCPGRKEQFVSPRIVDLHPPLAKY